jgi:hypothetical protein
MISRAKSRAFSPYKSGAGTASAQKPAENAEEMMPEELALASSHAKPYVDLHATLDSLWQGKR